MTPSEDRVLQLLRKWQQSLELHRRYVDLAEEQYWLVQPWPNHQRPTKWVVQLARQRVDDLLRIVQTRLAAGDPSLCEALELMSFLTNLVGSQHVQRFVPLAEPENERPLSSITMEMPAAEPVNTAESVTREMPPTMAPSPDSDTHQAPAGAAAASSPATRGIRVPPTAPATPPASRSRSAAARGRTRTRTPPAPAPTTKPPAPAAAGAGEVIADAARLLKWGRAWHELPDAIARLAGRPAAGPVREILKAHRSLIEQRAIDTG